MKMQRICKAVLMVSLFAAALTPFTTMGQTKSRTSDTASRKMSDTAFVRKNIHDNRMEIQLSQLALERATSDNVRSAAQMMVTDHTKMLNDLMEFARTNNMEGVLGSEMNISGDTTGGGVPGTDSAMQTGSNRGTSGTTNPGTMDTNSGSTSGDTSAAGGGIGSTTDPSTTTTNRSTGSDFSRAQGDTTGRRRSDMSGNRKSGSRSGKSTGAATSSDDMNNLEKDSWHNDAQHGMAQLQTLRGAEFESSWTAQMLTMHRAKLKELQRASATLKDATLKKQVTAAIPVVRTHVQTLSAIKQKPGSRKGGERSGSKGTAESGTSDAGSGTKNTDATGSGATGTGSGTTGSGSGTGTSGSGSGTGTTSSGSGTTGSGSGTGTTGSGTGTTGSGSGTGTTGSGTGTGTSGSGNTGPVGTGGSGNTGSTAGGQ